MYRLVLALVCGGILIGAAATVPGAPVPSATSFAGWQVDDLRVSGWPDDLPSAPVTGLALGQRSGLLRIRRPIFRPDLLADDERRLLLVLARAGYPHATLETRFIPESRKRRIRLEIAIAAGPAVGIGVVTVTGFPVDATDDQGNVPSPLPTDPVEEAELRLPTGDRFDDNIVEGTRLFLERSLLCSGHAHAEVVLEVAQPDSVTADLVFRVDPGRLYRFAETNIDGVPDDLARLARKSTGIRPGQVYSPEAVRQARDNLRLLQLYRQIRLRTEPTGDDPAADSIDLLADLREARPRTLRFSAGSWSDEPWRVRGFWRHRNLFRAGRGLEIRGAVSPHRRSLGSTAWWPALLGARSRSELTAGVEVEDEDSYDLLERSLGVAQLFRRGIRSSLRLGAVLSDVRLDDHSDDPDAFRTDDGVQLVLRSRWHLDRSDDLLDPTSGHRLDLDASWSPPGFLSQVPFWSAGLAGTVYRPLTGSLVLAGRLDLGAAGPLGDAEDLLPNRRFFAGGVNTMRGFKRRQLGPADGTGDPLGGDRRLLAGLELRFPLLGILGGALFADSGQVWSDGPDSSRQLRHALGGGLLIRTPVGPVRIDLARNLGDPPADEPRQVLHVSIGHPY